MEMPTSIKKLLAMGFFLGVFVSNCDKKNDPYSEFETADFSSEVLTEWMDLMMKLSKETPGFSPPVTARAFGYTALAAYESVRFGMPGYRSMAGQVNGFQAGMLPEVDAGEDYHWGVVANAAIAELVRGCFVPASPDNEELIENLEHELNQRFKDEVSDDIFSRSVALGKSVGTSMLEYTNSDGQAQCFKNNFPDSYTPPAGEGFWVRTPPSFQPALQPYWGDVRPFLTENITEVQPEAPPVYSLEPSSQFYKETMEVYTTVTNLTPEQRIIAEFWSDDPGLTATPPSHSISILKQILRKENADLARAAETFAKAGMALHDAFISCWKIKYTTNLIRPITVIHQHIDANFEIPLITPPFPEYTSGHSVQSGAAAQILTDLFGENYSFSDSTHAGRIDIYGSPRSFDSFFEFADEAAISRLYGGIHYRAAIERGVTQGKEIGKNIGALKFK